MLFAANRRYLSNEKGASVIADGFPAAPRRYAARVAESVGRLGAGPEALEATLRLLDELHDDVMTSAECG